MEGYYVEWGDEEPALFIEAYSIGFFINPFFRTFTIGTITDATTYDEKFCIGFGKTGMDGTLNYNSLAITGDNLYFIGTYTEF